MSETTAQAVAGLPPQILAFVKLMDTVPFKYASAMGLLRTAHRNFPLPGSGMPEDFKGTHSLTLVDGELVLNLWFDGKCWPIVFD